MKEPRFIELLNLYVDQQLTAAEAAELEAEIHRDPARRRTYQQYCRMQKACTLLFEQECKSAPGSSTLSRAMAEADLKTVYFPQPRRVWVQRGLYASGLAAMAACVALMMVRQPGAPGGSTVASDAPSTAVAAVEDAAQPVVVPPAEPSPRPTSQYSLLVAARMEGTDAAQPQNSLSDTADASQFDWMKQVELPPLRRSETEAWVFQTKPVAQPVRDRLASPRRPSQPLYENAAFQYQR